MIDQRLISRFLLVSITELYNRTEGFLVKKFIINKMVNKFVISCPDHILALLLVTFDLVIFIRGLHFNCKSRRQDAILNKIHFKFQMESND